MSGSVTELAAIGLKAIEYADALEAKRKATAEYRTCLAAWKIERGITHRMAVGDPLLWRMFETVGTSAVGVTHSQAVMNLANAKARLFRAIRRAKP